MNKKIQLVVFVFFLFLTTVVTQGYRFSGYAAETSTKEAPNTEYVPIKGMVTMLDLGAKKCIPCKMMIPVLEKVEKKYHGKAAIVFIDVWKNKEPAKRFGIRVIPTQIFFDKEGSEVYRHEGFMSETEIDQVFKKMGVS